MNQARLLRYAVRLMRVVLQSNMVPRIARAHANASTMCIPRQGRLAGCARATALLHVVMFVMPDTLHARYDATRTCAHGRCRADVAG
eukprot:8532428-Pyramimonas_sp.AAC.1